MLLQHLGTKIIKYAIVFTLFFMCVSTSLHAQYFSNGQEPSSIKWRQIQTTQFQVIYPQKFEAQAQLLTHWLEQAYKRVNASMASKPRKISVIVHSKTSYSNGMVVWAPRRMELYNSPHQFMDGGDWLQHLVLHEYRHVVQIEKMHQGFTKILSWLMGEQATVVPIGLYVPFWFLEGDAVVSETALSNFGRGRVPEFLQGFKALTLQKGRQKYDRAMLGSYKMYVPNYYETGYQIIAANRIYRDPLIFQHKMNNIGRHWANPFGGQSAGFRNATKQDRYYSFAIDTLEAKWMRETKSGSKIDYTPINNHADYESYTSLKNTKLGMVALKKSLYDVPEIVQLAPNGHEKRLVKLGGYAENILSSSQNTIMWAEQRNDLRWENRAYSDIYAYDINTKQTRRLTKKQRLFAPSIAPDNKTFVAVEATETNQYHLKQFDVNTGKLLRTIPNKDNGYPMHPSWSPDGDAIYFIHLGPKGKSLRSYTFTSQQTDQLIPAGNIELAFPNATRTHVYFTAAYNGQNNIYSYRLKDKKVVMVTNSMLGSNYALPTDSDLTFANYTANGYKPFTLHPKDYAAIPLSAMPKHPFKMAEALQKMEGGVIGFDTLETPTYASKKYKKVPHLIHFHSWSFPIAIDPVDQKLAPGVAVLSQNKLSTSFLSAGADFASQNTLERYYVNYSYEGWRPKLEFHFKTGADDLKPYSSGSTIYRVNQYRTGAKISMPFKVYKGVYYGGVFPSFSLDWLNYSYHLKTGDPKRYRSQFSSNFLTFTPEVYMYRFHQQALRDLQPRWGQYLKLGYTNANMAENGSGHMAYGLLQMYFPGLVKHHSLLISNGYQLKKAGDKISPADPNSGLFNFLGEKIAFPRGVNAIPNQMLYSFSSDYRMPLFYPDFNVWQFLYIKRVNLGLFYDYSFGTSTHSSDGINWDNFRYASVGGSLYFDFNPLRYEFNVRLGIQSGIILNTTSYFSGLILSFNI